VALASGVIEYTPYAHGRAVAFANNYAFDTDPACQCHRADLFAAKVDGSASRRLLERARYASTWRHLSIGADGDTVGYYDPDRNPTAVAFESIASGDNLWTEQDCRLDRPLVLEHGVGAVVKPMWTGARVDNAIEVIPLADPTARVRIGEEVRRLRVSDSGEAVAVLEYPYSATFYDGPTRIRLWRLGAESPAEYASFEFEGAVAFHLARFDERDENLLVHLDYHDNWRGVVAVLMGETQEVRRVSGSAEASAAQWIGAGHVAYLEDHAPSVPGPLRVAAAPFTEPASAGDSVHLYAPRAGACPAVVYADCSKYAPDEALCADATAGLYELGLTLP
jgi:hypothetical protein